MKADQRPNHKSKPILQTDKAHLEVTLQLAVPSGLHLAFLSTLLML